MTEDQFRDWDAAYVLGMLSSEDRRDFERHLTSCPSCSASVAELAGMPGILGTLSRDEAVALSAEADAADTEVPPHDPELVTRLAVAVGRRRQRVRLASAIAGVAAAAALVIGGVTIGSADNSSPEQAAAVAMTQVKPGLMTADISVTKKSWGTRFDWSCHYLNTAVWDSGTSKYELVATDNGGTDTVVATWTANGPKTTALAAASSLPTSSIRHLEIRLAGSTQPLTTLDL
ncbi:MAG: hypothetical protein QOJ72_99 [Nocardioidaceae bacterium]|jgi:hypothetical protein|nr:hypothetical protein [Nocardioidaceae bacterium]